MTHFDIIIKGGYIIDGTGAPPFRSDIGIINDTIWKLGDLSGHNAEIIINARGLYITPGFIDIHNHSDMSIFSIPTADNYIMQGVTTIVVGNCGSSPAPITDKNKEFIKELMWGSGINDYSVKWDSFTSYLQELDKLKKSVNVAVLVGHGTLRSAVLGFDNIKPSGKELKEISELLNESLKAGAFGMSLGLIYVPSMFANHNELTNLSKIVSKYGGILAVHMRDEGANLLDSIFEVITIARDTGVKLEISHLKAVGKSNWGKALLALKVIEDYSSRGLDISADAYPYEASSTFLSAILPRWVREGGSKELVRRLKSNEVVSKLREELMKVGVMGSRRLDWDDIMISSSPKHKDVEGLRINEIALKWGLEPIDVVIKLLIEDEGSTEMIAFGMNEHEVSKVISHPLVAIGSDGLIRKFGEGRPHPRNYGTFPRVIAKYVRELKLISLSEAIRKMTSLPARKLGLWNRGIIRPGFKADIVIFNYDTIKDTSTYTSPHKYPIGIEYVIVNGVVVVDGGRHIGNMPGKLLRHLVY